MKGSNRDEKYFFGGGHNINIIFLLHQNNLFEDIPKSINKM